MSEYIEIEPEPTDDPDVMVFVTNLILTEEGPEEYASSTAMEEGSPVAQALAFVEGIRRLRLEGSDMWVVRDPDAPWHVIAAEISTAVKEFFL